MKLVLTHRARRDLTEIEDYTAARWGDDQAARYIRALHDACVYAAGEPRRGRAGHDLPPSCRVLTAEKHLIIYRIDTDDDQLVVLGVFHPAMDFANRLKMRR